MHVCCILGTLPRGALDLPVGSLVGLWILIHELTAGTSSGVREPLSTKHCDCFCNTQTLEKLKKRAERFGESVSSAIKKVQCGSSSCMYTEV